MKKEDFICRVCGNNDYIDLSMMQPTHVHDVYMGQPNSFQCSGCSTLFREPEMFSLKPLKIVLGEDAKIPTKAIDSDTGYDLYSPCDVSIRPYENKMINLKIRIEPQDKNIATQIRSRSGMTKNGIFISNFGTIDQTYRGEYRVILYNSTDRVYYINKHDRICQLVIEKVMHVPFKEVNELGGTERGEGGFGSTGK